MPATKKTAETETLRQAQTWDHNASKYRLAGFCDVCAAQAAWGHQIGFSLIKPVCEADRGKPVAGPGIYAARWAGNESTSAKEAVSALQSAA